MTNTINIDDVCKGRLEICPIDSFDKISKLVNEEGYKKIDAYKKVADDWNELHPEVPANWKTLKTIYNRNSKPIVNRNKKVSMKPVIEKSFNETFSKQQKECTEEQAIAKCALYNSILKSNIELKLRIKDLEAILDMQSKVIDEYMLKEQRERQPATQTEPELSFFKSRTDIFKITLDLCDKDLKKYLTKTNVANQELFRIFSGIREDHIRNNKSFPEDFLLVKGII